MTNDQVDFDDEQSLEELIDAILKNLNKDIRLEFHQLKPSAQSQSSLDSKMACLWKLEEAEGFSQGGYAKWEQNYRLKHVATGKYLLIKRESSKVLFILSNEKGGFEGVFKFIR